MKKTFFLAIVLHFSFLIPHFSLLHAQVASSSEMIAPSKVGNENMIEVFAEDVLPGEYSVSVESSSSMFRITGATLYVSQGENGTSMKARITLGGKSYTKLFLGTAQEASDSNGAGEILRYVQSDGADQNDVPVAFEFPVSSLNVPIKCAAFSKNKKKWYDRDILFDAGSLPSDSLFVSAQKQQKITLKNGTYRMNVKLSGGSGRAGITSPAYIVVKDGFATAEIEWSSPNFDYMKVNRTRFDVDSKILDKGGNSTFTIPVYAFDKKFPVTADTIAMSRSHEIHYWLEFDSKSAKKAKKKR